MPEPRTESTSEREPADPIGRGDPGPTEWHRLERMLDELPPGIPILPPEDATKFSKYRYPPPMMPAPQAWKICADAMEKYDSDLCKAYREEIDTLLVFAGLFSAVVTGFTIESYQWLQDDPTDTTNALLAQLALSLAPNGTTDVPPTPAGMGRSVSARINAYWFISLALSLSAALVAILGKQWVREFERRASDRSPTELIGVRQLKLEGFEYWKVGDIISSLPMLLQLSLALFALGILELLWHLHTAVAVAVCIPTAAVVLFYSATTLLPVIQYSRREKDGPAPRQCAYKSPQTLAALHIYQAWIYLISELPSRLKDAWRNDNLPRLSHPISLQDFAIWNSRSTKAWDHWDTGFYLTDRYFAQPYEAGSPFRGLHWLSNNVGGQIVQEAYWNCLWDAAHSQDTHPADSYFPRYAPRDTRLRRGILHNRGADTIWTDAPLWQCAVMSIPLRHIAHECMLEILIQVLPCMDVPCAHALFIQFEHASSDDPELVRSLVKAVLSYYRNHINENIAGLIACTSDIVARCPDDATQSALQWVLVLLAANRLRSSAFAHDDSLDWQLAAIRRNTFERLSHSHEDFVHHPQRLHRLPHILALAVLLRAEYERHQPITWPVPGLDDMPLCRRSQFEIYMRDREYRYHPEWTPMVREVFKISVCGIDRDSSARPSEHTNGRRDSIGHRAPLDAVLSTGATETETAPSPNAAQTASCHSHDNALSAANLPSPGHAALHPPMPTEIAPAVDAVSALTLDFVVVSAGRDVARTSADAAIPGSLDREEAGVQDAGGGPALPLAIQSGGNSAGVRQADDMGMPTPEWGPPNVPAAPPEARSVRMPPQSGSMPAHPSLTRSRDLLALALPDEGNAHMCEAADAGDPGGHVGAQDQPQAEQLDAATHPYHTVVILPSLSTSTVPSGDPSDWLSSSIGVGRMEADRLVDEIATGAGDSGFAAAARKDDAASLAQHVRPGRHNALGPATENTRATDAPRTEEGRERTGISGAARLSEMHGGRREGQAEKTSGHTLQTISTRVDRGTSPRMHGSVSADPAGLLPDDHSGAEGIRSGRKETLTRTEEARAGLAEVRSLLLTADGVSASPGSARADDQTGVEELRGPAQDIDSERKVPDV